MSLPDDALSTMPALAAPLYPDNIERTDITQDFELGGVALNDASLGSHVRVWRAWTDGESVWVGAMDIPGDQHLVLTDTGISEVSLAFDQLMQPNIAYVANGMCKLRWYDTALPGYVTTSYSSALSPMLTLDDKRELHAGTSDIIFAYVRAKKLYYRQQRDRYLIERLMRDLPSNEVRIMSMGMNSANRLQVKLKYPYTAAHMDLLTGRLFLLSGAEIVPMFEGDHQEARWRSGVVVLDGQPSFAWARVEGGFPAKLLIYGDGVLVYTTPQITSEAPFRLPIGRYREWQLELVSTARCTGVYVANLIEEMED